MDVRSLYEQVHSEANPRAWTAGVKLARAGMVSGVTADAEEVHLKVRQAGRPPFDTWLFPSDGDWDCSCDLPKPCVHVSAGVIALHQGHLAGARGSKTSKTNGKPAGSVKLPEPKTMYQARVRYEFVSKKNALTVGRSLVHHNGKASRLTEALARTNASVSKADQQAETLLTMHRGGPLSAEMLRRLIALLDEDTLATLDGQPVSIRRDAVSFRVRVTHDGDDAFKVNLVRDPRMKQLFRGATVIDGGLHPTSHGRLNPDQRKLLVKGVRFSAGEVRKLVSEYLPALTDRIPVDVATDKLPEAHALVPRVRLSLATSERGLEVKAEIVYGDPPVARVVNDILEPLGDVVPARDTAKERAVKRTFEDRLGLAVGFRHVLPPDKAALFIKDRLPRHDGPVHGRDVAKNFKIVDDVVLPEIEVLPYGASALPALSGRAMSGLSDWARDEPGGYRLDVAFQSDLGHRADPMAVLAAWRQGRSLVPLLDGGYAPLPTGWLDEHGALLRELLESRDDQTGKVQRAATAALVELVEQVDIPAPPSLKKLHSFLEGDGTLPEADLPDDFTAELRPYQTVGFQWLRFLRTVDLNGVLADDMGLGKTVQALAALSDAGGRSLVVAPTSVLRNWEREANRFAPNLTVNVYHGPKRQLDDADLTLTSYALVRQDIDLLRDIAFTYAVLDEAQAIKNPDSQTAKAVRKLDARHRLCLTGTPVENRLEELWSLFHFLMPGFLSSKEAFRDRFVKPIEVGDRGAAAALRRRVKPYVLRRLKKQVAAELPELTDVVVRCPMTPEQRKVYDAVRLAMREDVQRAIQEKGEGGATLQVLEALLRMRQACCDPALLPTHLTTEGAGSSKLDRLEELLVEVVSEGHKVLVFSQWTSLLDQVEPRLAELDIDWTRLDGSTRNRQDVVDNFQSEDGPPVFLLTLKAGGTGLNLTAADYVVHLDPWWNPAVQQQATDRAHRIGQTNPVVSYRLVAEDSVEERILDLQDAKRGLAEAALGTDGGFVKSLSARELRALFEE